MKISTILDHIDSRHMALPEFQRGYVWNRDQVRGLFESLYRRHPVGGLLVWATESKTAAHRGEGPLAPGVVKLLLDGQQRMTSLYGVIRGKPPRFFDGNAQAFTGLHFHLEDEKFAFYQPVTMKDDARWIDVTALMQKGTAGLGEFVTRLSTQPALAPKVGDYVARSSRLLSVSDIELHVEEVTGADKSLDVVVDIFNRVNSGGTKLSKGDLALAKICADWPEARDKMKAELKRWTGAGFHFNLDWLLRSINTVLTGEAKFLHLHDKTADEVQAALRRATKHIDASLNLIGGRLGLDHDQVFFGRFGVPVMVRFLDKHTGPLNEKDRDKLLFWFLQAGMWGRFSGSTESFIDQDLEALEGDDGGLDKLLEQLRLWHGGLRVEPGHFTGWSVGARFYPVLYLPPRRTGLAVDPDGPAAVEDRELPRLPGGAQDAAGRRDEPAHGRAAARRPALAGGPGGSCPHCADGAERRDQRRGRGAARSLERLGRSPGLAARRGQLRLRRPGDRRAARGVRLGVAARSPGRAEPACGRAVARRGADGGRGQPGGLQVLHRRGGLQGLRAGGGAGRGGFFLSCSLGRCRGAAKRRWQRLLTFIVVPIKYRFSDTWR